MRKFLIPAALLIAATPGIASSPQNEPPAAEATGPAVNCIPLQSVRETKVRSDKVIDFIGSGGKVWRNELPYSCSGLNSSRRFLHKTSINQYCSVDTITVLYDPPMGRGATCGLGKFQPVKLAGK